MQEYQQCTDTAPTSCINPPDFASFGYTSRTWDGSMAMGAVASYFCEPPKTIFGYNGTATYDIFCAAQFFPNWQGWMNSMITVSMPVCQ